MTPHNINPVQWNQYLGYSRQACARIFRDGGSATDAIAAFGLDRDAVQAAEWSRAVDLIAAALCHQHPLAKAA